MTEKLPKKWYCYDCDLGSAVKPISDLKEDPDKPGYYLCRYHWDLKQAKKEDA